MSGLAIILLIVIFFWLIWPPISRYLKRKAMERAEDYVRSSMGMPPRDKNRNKRSGSTTQGAYYRQRREEGNYHHKNSDHPIIPPDYAEDVEFTEIKEFHQKEIHTGSNPKDKETIYHESQISDVEFTEIKKSRGQ